MFQFPGFPAHDYLIHHALRDSSSRGFPHSEICGSMLICSSPQLIAACHVLLRLPMPRHSPYALLRLNYLQQFDLLLLVLASCKNCCAHTFAVLMAKLFFPIAISEKPDFLRVSPLSFMFPLLFCHVCLTCILSNSYDSILSYSVFNEHPPFRVS